MKIKTIKSEVRTKFKEKESLFIGIAIPVEGKQQAEEKLNEIRKEFYDATHHCFAYLFFDGTEKYSDDGEPTGTAGIRLLNAINHFELTNVLLVSVRYFGGKKLGVGPLGKAYYRSGIETLEAAEILEKEEYLRVAIVYEFAQSKTVHHFLQKNSAIIKENLFDEKPKIIAMVKTELVNNLENELIKSSNGKIEIEKFEKYYF